MGKFKVGDKVTLSDVFYLDCPSTHETSWVNKLKAKVEEGGYITITDVLKDGTYCYKNEAEDIDVYLNEEWLEPCEITISEVPRYFNLFVVDSLSFTARILAEAPCGPDIQPGDIVEIGEGRGNMYKVVLKCGMDMESDYYKCVKSLTRCKEFEKITRYYKMHEVKEVQDGEVQDR